MFWLIHYTDTSVIKQDYYGLMSVKQARHNKEPEGWLNYNGYKLTKKKFRDEKSAVTYCERLLKQDNLPDTIKQRLKAFVDKYYTKTSFILDSLDNQYDPVPKKK